jgi:hypothetical protein
MTPRQKLISRAFELLAIAFVCALVWLIFVGFHGGV